MSIIINGQERDTTINAQSLEAHSARVLADNPALYEAQRQNNFEFVVSGLNGITRVGTIDQKLSNAEEYLRLAVDQSSVPHYEQGVIEIKRGNTTMKSAGVISFASGTLVINDYIGANTKEILMSWQNLSGNPQTGKVGLMKDYKKNAWLVEYTPDYQEVRKWRIVGCWISGMSEDAYSQSADGKKLITAAVPYDLAYIDNSEI